MKKFIREFKEFALKGNVIDMAVGVIIGAAFKDIVTSLVENLLNPLIGMVGGANFDQYVLTINGAEFRYGSFITTVINFLIMAFIIFLLVKGINKLTSLRKKETVPAVVTTKICPYCRSEVAIEATRCPHCTSHLDE